MAGRSRARATPRIETLDPEVAAVYRRMTPSERLSAAFETTEFVRTMVRAGLRSRHPEWSDERLDSVIAERFRGGAA